MDQFTNPEPLSRSPLLAANFHLYKPCNAKCRFCFATFRDVDGRLDFASARRLLLALRMAGCEKITFVGGEPTLHPHIGELLTEARCLGFVTCIVTNGARLSTLLKHQPDTLDWVGLSIDSSVEAIQAALGRGRGDHVAGSIRLADEVREKGIRLKLNTVVTALNWQEDMSALVRRLQPERWKVFQVLPLTGQNDGSVEDLLITAERFAVFVSRHQHLSGEGLAPIVENNDAMRGSYVMIDPLGRFFGNATGEHVYSEPILEVGVSAALSEVGFEVARFDARGGRYDW